LTGFYDIVKVSAFAFALANHFLDAQIRAHDLQQGVTAITAQRLYQSLADNPPQSVRQTHANLLLFLSLEHTADTIDGLAGIDGVQGA